MACFVPAAREAGVGGLLEEAYKFVHSARFESYRRCPGARGDFIR